MDSARPLDATRVLPDYTGGGLLNLMASLEAACGGAPTAPVAAQLPPASLAGVHNLVLVILDGLGYRYLTTRTPDSALARHLRGALTSVFPSTTASAITTTLTGRAPAEHGLTGWHLWLAETGAVTAVLPQRARDGGALLPTDPAALFPCASFFDRIARPAVVVSPQAIIDTVFNTRHCGRAVKRPYAAPADFFPAVARAVHETSVPTLIYAYYPEFDGLAHAHGVGSAEVAREFTALDAAWETFLERIADTDTTVVLTADHGFIDGPPERLIDLDAHPRLTALLARPLCGERRVAYCYLKDGADADFRAYVETELGHATELIARDALLASGWFGPGPVHPRLADRVGDYALVMRADWTIKDWLPEEKRHPMIGVHAGLTADEMLIPLVVHTTAAA
ncbi:MAG: alkaline phosphatase family protein [Burkholderiales bacterium]